MLELRATMKAASCMAFVLASSSHPHHHASSFSLHHISATNNARHQAPRLWPTHQLSAAASDSVTDIFTKGRLVEFTTGSGTGKSTALGTIVGPDGKKNLKILTSSGRTASVPPRSIRHIVPNAWSIEKEEQIEQHERVAMDALEEDAQTNGQNVIDVWEMLLDDKADAVELTTLADLLVGDDTSTSCYATRAVLSEGVENFCFKEIGSTKGKLSEENICPKYEPRAPDIVESLRSQARAEAEEQTKWAQLKQRIDDACKNPEQEFCIQDESEEIQTALKSLERLGCLANLSPEEAEREEKTAMGADAEAIGSAKEFLPKIGRRATPEAARALIVGIGVWDVHTNLDLIRLRIPTAFAADLEDLAAEIAANPPPDLDEETRVDLTHLQAFAIDEASTKEIDDALSVEILDTEGPMHTRQRFWIHIADPSRYIEIGSPLDKEARRRTTSIYLPTGTVPMFPLELASGPLSLSSGEVSCALSVGLMFDADGGIDEDVPPIITPSLVKVARLTYEEVDRLLDPFAMVDENSRIEDSDIDDMDAAVDYLRRLQWASEERLQWRIDGGSLESIGPYEMPDMMVKAQPSPDETDGWAVDICARERFAASRIVTELALAANEAIALYGRENRIPMPFRCQEVDEVSDEEIEATPEGPCRSWLAIRSTTRSQITSNPRPHGGLGLDLYVQATSPIRRYADLALHHQIKAYLRGDAIPFPGDEEGSSVLVRVAQNGGMLSRELERPTNDYWLKEFLRRKGTDSIEVLVLSGDRYKDDLYKLLIPELGAICSYRSTKPLAVGGEMSMSCSVLADALY